MCDLFDLDMSQCSKLSIGEYEIGFHGDMSRKCLTMHKRITPYVNEFLCLLDLT